MSKKKVLVQKIIKILPKKGEKRVLRIIEGKKIFDFSGSSPFEISEKEYKDDIKKYFDIEQIKKTGGE